MEKLVLEDIRGRIDLRDIALQSLKGKQTGQRVTALCPWHPDTDPSLSITEQSFYCFGCHKGGDVFTWFMQNGMGFLEAVAEAAKIAGVQIDDDFDKRIKAAAEEKQNLAALVDSSQALLWETPAALEYLRGRGLSDSTIVEFRLGWHRQRQAIVIPMTDLKGEVLAYSLRDPKKQGPNKYWHHNTPSFKYGNHLYNETALWLHPDDVHLVEGPFDVMKLHQAGFSRSVGIFSGLINENQVKRLAEKCERVVLLPDTGGEGDWKKLQQNVRSLRMTAPELNLMVAVPPEKDAGDCSEEQLRQAIAEKKPPEIVLLDLVVRGEPAEQYERARSYINEISDPLLRDDVIQQLAEKWGKSKILVEQSLCGGNASNVIPALTMGDAIEKLQQQTVWVANSKLKLAIPGLKFSVDPIQPGHFVGIGAYPKVGKTMTMLNCMRLIDGDFMQVFFSMEQPPPELAKRLMIMESWANGTVTDNARIRAMLLAKSEEYRTLKELVEFKMRKVRVVGGAMTVGQMEQTLQSVAATSSLPLGIVWLDYLGLVLCNGSSEYERVSQIALAMPQLAEKFNVIVCAAIQLRRPERGIKDRPPTYHDFRGSGVIEQAVDLAIGIHPEKTDDSGIKQTLNVEVLVTRHGPPEETKWLFRRDSLLIRELMLDRFD